MKNLMLCACAIILTTGLFAQEKRKEVSVNFSSFDEFGLSYKSGTAKSLWRYHLLSINGGVNDHDSFSSVFENPDNNWESSSETKYYGIGITIGKEFRNTVAKQLEIRYGFDVGFSFGQSNNTSINDETSIYENESTSLTPSVNGVIGLNYIFNENLAIGVELLPRISYTTSKGISKNISNDEVTETEYNSDTFNFSLNNQNARLSLAYRF